MRIEKYVQGSLLLAIGASYDTIWRDLNWELRKDDFNLLQALLLISIFFESNETVTPSMLARTLNASAGNVSHGLSHLEKRGLIQRVLSPNDARSYRLRLKPEGRRLACRLIQVIDGLELFFENECGKENVARAIRDFGRIRSAYLRRKAPQRLSPAMRA